MCSNILKTDIQAWISPIKISYADVCIKFGIDVVNDRRNAFFWNLNWQQKVIINDEVLEWCGYSGKYKNMKTGFAQLLKKNTHISYEEIPDEKNKRKFYFVLEPRDFETLLMQMRSPKAREIREIYADLKNISIIYTLYEKYYAEYRENLAVESNLQLVRSVDRLEGLMERAEKRDYEMCDKLDKMGNEMADIKTNLNAKVVDRLREEVSPLVAPESINTKKERCLALINTKPGYEWYIVRRQRETFNSAMDKVLEKYKKEKPSVVKRWYKISHSVDVGNSLKNRLRNLRWMARGNILSAIDRDAGPSYSNDVLIQEIENILNKNIATTLSDVTKQLID